MKVRSQRNDTSDVLKEGNYYLGKKKKTILEKRIEKSYNKHTLINFNSKGYISGIRKLIIDGRCKMQERMKSKESGKNIGKFKWILMVKKQQ